MKKMIFCICFVISLLLTTQAITFAQLEDNLTDYLGVWCNSPDIGDKSGKRYLFKGDGSFVYGSSFSTKEEGDLLYSEGTWTIENNMLNLTINGKIMKTNQGKIYYNYPKKKETIQYKITEVKEEKNEFPTITINGLKYWKFDNTNNDRYSMLFGEYKQITYVGVWHADTYYKDTDKTTNLFRKRYLFKEDGTFVYGTNTKNRDGKGNLLYLDGNWSIENNMLTLETTGKVIEENGENKYIKLEKPQIEIYGIDVPKEFEKSFSLTTIDINGLQYWNFSNTLSRYDMLDMFREYNKITSVLNTENICGNWNKTDTLIGKPVSLTITDQKDGTFKFKFETPHLVGIYRLAGEAMIYDKNSAIFLSKQNNNTDLYIIFTKNNDTINVSFHRNFNKNNWIIEGNYVQESPLYIDYKSEIFKEKKLEQKVKTLMGETAFKQMIFIMDRAEHQDRLTYTGTLEEKDMKVELLINNEHIYCLGYNLEKENWVLYTDDKNYKNSIPEFFKLYDNTTIEYVYKEI